MVGFSGRRTVTDDRGRQWMMFVMSKSGALEFFGLVGLSDRE